MAGLGGIAVLKVLENFRQNKRSNVLADTAPLLADDAPTPELLIERELALEACIEKLLRMRDLLWRRYSRRQSSVEMADAAGMSSTAVRVALSKTRAILRDCIHAKTRVAE